MNFKSSFTLSEISNWAENNEVELPNVQRGFVWKPSQIELLWDSILQGYPIGSFVLTKQNNGKLGLLDGQQRATAICLSYGKKTFRDSTIRVFIDLAAPSKEDNRRFIIRVITNSHPWGYQRRDNTKPLEAQKIREAMLCFGQDDCLELELKNCFPYDAIFPVPIEFFLDSKSISETINKIGNWELLSKVLDKFNQELQLLKNKKVEKDSIKNKLNDYQKLSTIEKREEIVSRFYKLFSEVDEENSEYKIPALYLDYDNILKNSNDAENEKSDTENLPSDDYLEDESDHIENLFVRLNSGGTQLRGEDLNYSILKAHIHSDLQKLIEESCKKIIKPARFITLVYRLFQNQVSNSDENIRDSFSMRVKPKQFQKQITKKNKDNQFTIFLENILKEKSFYNKSFLEYIESILLFNDNNKKIDLPRLSSGKTSDFGLPRLLLEKISDSAPEVMFALFYRIYIKKDRIESAKDRQKVLGMLSLFMWFGKGENNKDHSKLLRNIIPCLKNLDQDLFWSSSTVQRAMIDNVLVPIADYKKAKSRANLTSFLDFKAMKSNTDIFKKIHEKTECTLFINNAFYNRDLILYAQRAFLSSYFKERDFDLDDTNMPFDWDHISPHKLLHSKKGMPFIVKSLYNTIGNFRAWPYSLNRGDQADKPAQKFNPLKKEWHSEESKQAEVLKDWQNFITSNSELINSINKLSDKLLEWSFCDGKWLYIDAEDLKSKEKWEPTCKQILDRNIKIIGAWYDELDIKELIPVKLNLKKEFSFLNNFNKSKWKSIKTFDKKIKERLIWDEEVENTSQVSNEIKIEKNNIRIFMNYPTEESRVVHENEFYFGVYSDDEKFIENLKIKEDESGNFSKDKYYVLNQFTLVSIDYKSQLKLISDFKNWLKKIPLKEKDRTILIVWFQNSLTKEVKEKI